MTRWLLALTLVAFVGCGGDDAPTDSEAADSLEPLPGLDVSDASVDTTPDVEADLVEEVEEPEVPGLGLDYETLPTGATPRYEPDGEEWTSRPWPSDLARTETGNIDISVFPNSGSQLWQDYLNYGAEVLDGFGANSAVYFQFDGALDPTTLPDAWTTMTDAKSAIQLVNVTEGSPHYAKRVPVEYFFYKAGKDLYYLPNTLAVRPVYGFPLAENETYCAVVTRGVVDAEGGHLQVAQAFADNYEEDTSLAGLRAWLPDSMLLKEDLAVATCFTTADVTSDMRRIRAYLEDEPLPVLENIAYYGTATTFHQFEGQYLAPNFQEGQKPYDVEGGDFVFDENGDPVIQLEESIKFILMIPTGFQMPSEGWPIVLYGHGTGGDHQSCKNSVAADLVMEAVAVICIDQPLHGARGEENWDVEFLSFNFSNPRAGRTNFRQAAVDIMNLARMVSYEGMDHEADAILYESNPEKSFDKEIRFDPEQVHYFGHSHGGLSGALAFGLEPRLISGVLSGAGGGFTETVLRRKDIADFKFLFASLMKVDEDDLDAFHPAITMLQTLVDATDPLNYAPYWLTPGPSGRPKHVFLTCGTDDEATPYVTTTAMAAAAGIPMLQPVAIDDLAHQLKGLEPVKSPVTLNLTAVTGEKITGALRQWEGWDHFVAFDHPDARAMWQSFFRGIRYGQDPIIGL